MSDDALFVMPQHVHTRWASPENWEGAKGAAGQANGGRKGSPCFPLKAGEHLAETQIRGAEIMPPLGDAVGFVDRDQRGAHLRQPIQQPA